MLRYLQIRDYTLIAAAELEFADGFTAVTGETGAGKSLILDALATLLGERADPEVIRSGAAQADITAVFDLRRLPHTRAWLAERDLATANDDCQLRRVIAAQGRSRAYVNGVNQPLHVVKQLAEQLVTLHGQHASQQLLERDYQRQLLDALADDGALAAQVTAAFRAWRQAEQDCAAFDTQQQQRDERLAMLDAALARFRAVDVRTGELDELVAEQRRLTHGGRLFTGGQRLLQRLDEEMRQKLTQCQRDLAPLQGLDAAFLPIAELVEEARIQLEEAAQAVERYLGTLDLDHRRLAWVETRLSDIERLARQERLSAEVLGERQAALAAEYGLLSQDSDQREALDMARDQAWAQYDELATALTRQRQATAARFVAQVTAGLRDLGMQQAQFAVELGETVGPTATGREQVAFFIAANPGQPPRPLAKVASGGELSRIALAIQVNAKDSGAGLRVFDEIDAGIGGAVAAVMGRQLRQLGTMGQVLCVTHLAQVAACSHQHLRVTKRVAAQTTVSEWTWLSPPERVAELARMLGGVEVTTATRNHAQELLFHSTTTDIK